jgi:hypothetical protein
MAAEIRIWDMMDNENDPTTESMDPSAEELGESGIQPAATDNPLQPGLLLPDDVTNLVPYLLEKAQSDPKVKKFIDKDLPEQVVKHFNEDWDASKGWREKRLERMKLFLGALEPKTFPFQNCANMHVPILATRILRLAARVWAEIFKQGQPVFSAQASSELGEDRADLITKHENWQFRHEIPDFPKQVMRALIEFFRDGDCIFDSRRDLSRNVNVHESLNCNEFVYPYTRKSTAPDMSDVPRKTKILFPYKRDLKKAEKDGFYAQVDDVTAEDGTHDIDLEQIVKDAADRFEGKDRSEHLSDAPYYLLEYHGWTTFPYQDEEVPIIAVVDGRTRILLGLYSRYYDDPADRSRFDQQTAEHQQYISAIGRYQHAMQLEQKLLTALQQPGVPSDESLAVAKQVNVQRPQPPIAPQWLTGDMEGPLPCKQKIIERFSHGTCIENPDGSHGLGLGMLLMPHQAAANILLNQFIDQGTRANTETGFMHENFKLDPGVKTINPGEILRVRGVPPDQIEKAYYPLKPPPANSQLLQGVSMQENASDGITSAPDVLSGQKEGDETFRGQATRVEQATKQLTVFASNFIMVLNQVAKNNGLLNYQFLPDSKFQDVMDPATLKSMNIKVTRELYRGSYDITFSADLSFSSRAAKIAECDDALGMVTKGIPAQIASLIFPPTMFAVIAKNCFRARGMYDLAGLVLSDREIMAKVQPAPPGIPGAPGVPSPGAPQPHPSVPSGAPTNTPGVRPPMRPDIGVPTEAAPGQ